MKIERLELKNLNSLKGTHSIDFSGGPLGDAGLFAVTGPTGAGKTTIFDAVCLALYGQTPRIQKSDSRDRKTNREEIVTRNCTEAVSECSFSVLGVRYCSRFEIHRARMSLERDFVDPAMTLSEEGPDGGYRIIEDKLKAVPERVEEITGLSFERFTRSIMLAQGDFDAFLTITSSERAELLEKLTGTSVYSKLSRAAFRRFGEENEKLKSLTSSLDALELLSGDDAAELAVIIEGAASEAAGLETRIAEKRRFLDLYAAADEETRELENLKAELASLQSREREIAGLNETLERANSAEQFRPGLEAFESTLRRTADLEKSSARLSEERDAVLRQITAADEESAVLAQQLETLRREDAQNQQRAAEAKELESAAARLGAELGKAEEAEQQLLGEKQRLENRLRTVILERDEARRGAAAFEEWLKDNPEGSRLLENWPRIEAELERSRKLSAAVSGGRETVSALSGDAENHSRDIAALQEKEKEYSGLIEEAKGKREDAKAALDSCASAEKEAATLELAADRRKKYDGQKKKLEAAALRVSGYESELNGLSEKIEGIKASLANPGTVTVLGSILRKELKHGKPCPVCGSREHPAKAQGELDFGVSREESAGEKDSVEIIRLFDELNRLETEQSVVRTKYESDLADVNELSKGLEELSPSEDQTVLDPGVTTGRLEELAKLTMHADSFREELNAAETAVDGLQASLAGIQRQRTALESEANAIDVRADEARKRLSANEKELEETNRFLSGFGRGADLEKRYREGRGLEGNAARSAALIQEKEKERIVFKGKADSIQEQLAGKTAGKAAVEQELSVLRSKLTGLIGESAAADFAQASAMRCEEAAEKHQAVLRRKSGLEGRRTALDEQYDAECRTLDSCRKESALQEKSLTEKAVQKGFGGITEVRSALIAIEERGSIAAELDKHKMSMQALTARTEAAQKRSDDSAAKLKGAPAAEDLAAEAEELALKRNEVLSGSGAARERLDRDKETRRRAFVLEKSIEEQKKHYDVWNLMNSLIGSRDGRAFQRFAQSVTLDRLIENANAHLRKLSSRYVLGRRDQENLSLEITDTWQGNIIRPVTTLSGGETFVVSLSLALGLSGLVSNRLNIDTLFLDEGFGTLDADTLETVLSVLETFRAQGKQIGVISHVDALKDRIQAKIEVSPVGNGHSKITVKGYAGGAG